MSGKGYGEKAQKCLTNQSGTFDPVVVHRERDYWNGNVVSKCGRHDSIRKTKTAI